MLIFIFLHLRCCYYPHCDRTAAPLAGDGILFHGGSAFFIFSGKHLCHHRHDCCCFVDYIHLFCKYKLFHFLHFSFSHVVVAVAATTAAVVVCVCGFLRVCGKVILKTRTSFIMLSCHVFLVTLFLKMIQQKKEKYIYVNCLQRDYLNNFCWYHCHSAHICKSFKYTHTDVPPCVYFKIYLKNYIKQTHNKKEIHLLWDLKFPQSSHFLTLITYFILFHTNKTYTYITHE